MRVHDIRANPDRFNQRSDVFHLNQEVKESQEGGRICRQFHGSVKRIYDQEIIEEQEGGFGRRGSWDDIFSHGYDQQAIVEEE